MNDDRLQDLLLAWEERQGSGEPITAEELCRDCPELATKLQEQMSALDRLAWMKDAAAPNPPSRQLLRELAPGSEPVRGFRLVEMIGRGGFGEVWKATGPDGGQVALKVVPLGGRLVHEELRILETLRSVRHPHLLLTHDCHFVDDSLVLIMELAERTLLERWQEARRFGEPGIPKEELLRYLIATASALDFLHDHDIHHRDIKPQNLLLVGKTLKVADFGLARVLVNSVTAHSGAMTIAYAAPEFFDRRTTKQSDQYCLAVTYCHLRTGQLPFVGSLAEVMSAHLHKRPELGMLPENERHAVARALAKKPEDRWPSCLEFVANLRFDANSPDSRGRRRRQMQVSVSLRWMLGVGLAIVAIIVVWLLALHRGDFTPKKEVASVAPEIESDPKAMAKRETPATAKNEDSAKPAVTNVKTPATRPITTNAQLDWPNVYPVFRFNGKSRILTPLARFAPVTLEAWIKPSAVPDSRGDDRDKHFISTDLAARSGLGLYLTYIRGDDSPHLAAIIPGGGVQIAHLLPLEKWSHVAGVFGPDATVLYVNGKDVGRGKGTPNVPGPVFAVGGHGPGNPSDRNNFTGGIHSVRISKGLRYTAEFAPPVEFESDQASVCILRADRCKDNQAIDQSGHGNHGTINGVSISLESKK